MLEREIINAFNGAATGIAIADRQGRFVQTNAAYRALLGYTEEELQWLDFLTVTHPDDRLLNQEENAAMLSGERRSAVLEKRYVRKDGSLVWGRLSLSALRDDNQAITGLIAIVEDITEAKQALARQVETERSMATLVANLPGVVYRCRFNDQWTMHYLSASVQALTGYEPCDLLYDARVAYGNLIHPADRPGVSAEVEQAIADDRPFQMEYRLRHADGSYRWVWEQGRAVRAEPDAALWLEGYITDIDAQKTAEARLQEAQRQASAILRSVGEGIYGIDMGGNITFVNPAAARLLGWSAGQMLGKNAHELMHYQFADGAPFPADACPVHATLRDGKSRQITDGCFFRADGTAFPVEYVASPIVSEAGDIVGAVISFSDIGARLALEEQVRKSQRLESIGQLTGGIAHDFNNLLTVILGNAELLEEMCEANPAARKLATMVLGAAERGAQLTQALLAFARKQPLAPRSVDLRERLDASLTLLQRTLGEHIQLTCAAADNLPRVLIDAVQLDSALLNLAINARDAMPMGGALSFNANQYLLSPEQAAQFELRPGAYVRLDVTDQGEGIPAEHLPRLFEPFFTTKETGRGTGLGLPMVYGFLRQSGGHVVISSRVGQGTTVSLYLPTAPDE